MTEKNEKIEVQEQIGDSGAELPKLETVEGFQARNASENTLTSAKDSNPN